MNHAKGSELQELTQTLGPLQIKKIMLQLLEALKYLHSIDVVHRDIKPENIIVDEETMGTTLVDFNVSRKLLTSN